jgi:serine/threonine protein kinase
VILGCPELQQNTNCMEQRFPLDGKKKYQICNKIPRSAPELLSDEKATIKSDVWSFGIVVYEIIENGEVPYNFLEKNVDVVDYVLEGKRLPKSTECPEPMYKLMLQCWEADAQNRYIEKQIILKSRPSFKEIIHTLKSFMSEKVTKSADEEKIDIDVYGVTPSMTKYEYIDDK